MLHGGESVAQHTYIIVTFPEIVEKPDGTRDEGLLLCEAFEIDGVEFPTEFHKFFVGACPPFVERCEEAVHTQEFLCDFLTAVAVPKRMVV